MDVFVYRIQKYIGAYTAALGGVDAIVFTAGIGENSPSLRREVLRPFGYLGLRVDDAKNEQPRPSSRPRTPASTPCGFPPTRNWSSPGTLTP